MCLVWGREGRPSDDRRGADVLSAGHQPPVYGDDAHIQQGESHHLQHLPVLPQGSWQCSQKFNILLQLVKVNKLDIQYCW